MLLTPRIVGEGFVSRYLRFVTAQETPPSFHLVSLMALFSALIERRLLINRGYTIRANIFCLILGPPAVRKTYGTRIVRQVFADAGLPIKAIGENATDEGVLKEMVRKEKKGESPTATIIAEEFGVLVGKKQYQEGLIQWLCRAYDGGELGNTRSVDSYGVEDAFLTLLAGTTPKALKEISESILGTGLASRMWIVSEKQKDKWVWRPKFPREERLALAEEFKEIAYPILEQAEILFDPGEEADAYMEEWYMGPHREFTEKETDEKNESWAGRRHDHAMRAAVLLHLLDGGGTEQLTVEAAQRGIDFIEAMEPGMFEAYGMLGASEWGVIREKVQRMIEKKGEDGIQMRHLQAAVSKWVKTPGEEARAILSLLQSGDVVTEGSGGKMRIKWRGEE